MSEAPPPRAEILRTRDFVGWGVADGEGGKIGTVGDLLIDRRGRVRFLSVDLGLFKKRVLIPVEMLEWGEDRLVLPRRSAEQVKHFPPYDPDRPLTADALAEMEAAHPDVYGAARDAEPEAHGEPKVVPLSEAKGFKLAGDASDLRGWTVFGADGERAGTVSGMIVDPAAMKVRYLDVDLADDLYLLADDRHVLVPLEVVELKERGQDALIDGLAARDLARLPAYVGGAVTPLVERRVRAAFGMGPRPPLPPAGDEG